MSFCSAVCVLRIDKRAVVNIDGKDTSGNWQAAGLDAGGQWGKGKEHL